MLLAGFAVLFAAPLGLLVIALLGHESSLLTWMTTWGTPIDFGVGAFVCLAAAQALPGSRPWRWFALACALWTGANLYFALSVAPDPLPLPSWADVGYFTFPGVVCLGIVQVAQARLPRVPFHLWVDAVIVALSAGAVAAVLVFSVVDVATDDIGAVITSLIYPMEDVVVIGLVVGVGMLLSWRLDRQMIVLFAGALAVTAADLIVATRVLNGDPLNGAWSNFGWTSGIALFAVAGWVQAQPPAVLLDRPLASHATVPAGASAVGLIIVTAGTVFDLSPVAEGFAVAAVAIGCVRMQLSFAEARALADSHRLALADELTDLPNRRRLMRDLRLAFETQAPSYLALYDLDGFKHFNDTHGHSDGDRLLISLATRLAETVGAVGTAYRLGGDEFCVLTPATEDGDAAIRAGGAALHATGADWRVGATYGVVEIPREVSTVGDAVRTADRRMYAEKDRRPVAARQQVRDVLLSALGEQQPTLHTHTQDVTAMAGAVARSLGMKPREVDEVVRAAELHDVGKLAIPATVLDKPGPLNDEEWDLIHQHTIIGERMLAAAASLRPVASLVRSSHERWDGHGYPDGLRGEQIPLGARIVAVCDSYDAMIAERPYQAGMPLHEALAEIRRCAGTQFDPAVVDAFVRIAEAGRSASARLS